MIDNESWQISIEQTTDFVRKQLGAETIKAIFQKYNASCLEDLNPCYYPEVFGELYQYEVDLKD